MQMVVITPTSSQLRMSETGRVEANLQKEIVVADILDADTATYHPTIETGDQSDTNDYEGFLDLGFIPQADVFVVPLNVIYPDSYFEGEVPQGTNSYIESDQLNPRKRKASTLGGAHEAEARSSFATGDP